MKPLKQLSILFIAFILIRCSETKQIKTISPSITGDWKFTYSNWVHHIRFQQNGLFSYKDEANYSLLNNNILAFGTDTFTRVTGNSAAIVGSWKKDYPSDSTSLIIYLNNDNSYHYYWTDNGLNGDGYYCISNNVLTIFEVYGYYYCQNDSITQISLEGYKGTAKYEFIDSTLTVYLPVGPTKYERENSGCNQSGVSIQEHRPKRKHPDIRDLFMPK